MSADNFFFIRKDGVVEERRESFHDQPGEVIFTGKDQEDADEWAEREMRRREELGGYVEYGIEWED